MGPENHQFLPKCCKYYYLGHSCNGLNIPQKYSTSRYAAEIKNKENNFDDTNSNTAKLGLDFKMQMAKLGKH